MSREARQGRSQGSQHPASKRSLHPPNWGFSALSSPGNKSSDFYQDEGLSVTGKPGVLPLSTLSADGSVLAPPLPPAPKGKLYF